MLFCPWETQPHSCQLQLLHLFWKHLQMPMFNPFHSKAPLFFFFFFFSHLSSAYSLPKLSLHSSLATGSTMGEKTRKTPWHFLLLTPTVQLIPFLTYLNKLGLWKNLKQQYHTIGEGFKGYIASTKKRKVATSWSWTTDNRGIHGDCVSPCDSGRMRDWVMCSWCKLTQHWIISSGLGWKWLIGQIIWTTSLLISPRSRVGTS